MWRALHFCFLLWKNIIILSQCNLFLDPLVFYCPDRTQWLAICLPTPVCLSAFICLLEALLTGQYLSTVIFISVTCDFSTFSMLQHLHMLTHKPICASIYNCATCLIGLILTATHVYNIVTFFLKLFSAFISNCKCLWVPHWFPLL